MSRLASVNLIGLFDLYLIFTFLLSVLVRYRQYQTMLGLILSVPGRWPKLFQLASQHRTLFVNWSILLPVILTFGAMLVHTVLYYAVSYQARVTPRDLGQHWFSLGAVVAFGGCMLVLDYDAIFNVGQIDRADLEKNLDQAEYWLRSWVSSAVRTVTFGYVDPRRMVDEEVRKAMSSLTTEFHKMMWMWTLQLAVRLAFGLSLWLTWLFAAP